jgi:hypothetical protein
VFAEPEHRSFEYTYRAVEGRMAFLKRAYEDANVRVRDGADSYLIDDSKIVAQTIRCTVEAEIGAKSVGARSGKERLAQLERTARGGLRRCRSLASTGAWR